MTLAVLGAGYYGFQLQYPAARTARACSGMLAADPVLDLAGKSGLSVLGLGFDVSSRKFDVSGDVKEPAGLATRCMVDGIEIAVETTAGAQNAYGAYQDDEKASPVPLSGGWQGLMVTDGEEATASVLLSCRNWSPNEGSGILVTADSPFDVEVTEAIRLKLARAATATAQRAADKTGCETEPGDAGKVTAPAAGARTVSAGAATGTCEGMTSAPTVRETAAAKSPVEACVLVDDLRLVAAYGPFSDASAAVVNGKYGGNDKPSGIDRSTAWTSATCPGALGTGYYHASPVGGSVRRFTSDPLTEKERADLRHFAEQSAARHGCGAPEAVPS
ncbi:hypothetical protein M2163_006924 [Streptomyces sp. SAI-135]|uniref:hypothetical protein n=2 Tax=Streptomyces TaxID=1883 RepID=UPI0024733AB1|nr:MULTISPECIES: hypothetical protein [unclassified Streptomyces]MDH6548312.1 hypothetical protein [Streptomyces sp. SAI-041]MDH6587665.1 hypothetical protein [Streptomyces sp. SAI-133]MDH6619816.1 hypothetical protein [Streptomyces sp. SAI-135]